MPDIIPPIKAGFKIQFPVLTGLATGYRKRSVNTFRPIGMVPLTLNELIDLAQ